MVGASGAIAGMIGAYTMLYGYSAQIKIFWLIWVYPVRFQMPAIAFGGAWFLLQMWNGSFDVGGNLSGVAWMAHIGGFASGVLTMLVYRNFTDRKLVQNDSGECPASVGSGVF